MGATVGGGVGRVRSRRALLRAATGVTALALAAPTAAGCGLLDRRNPGPPTPPDPLQPLLAQTRELAARYDAAIAGQPSLAARLTPLRDATAEHATTLARLIGADPSPAPPATASAAPPDTPAAVLADLRAAELAGQRSATEFCLAAPGDRAPLLGSIVAARAAHQAILA